MIRDFVMSILYHGKGRWCPVCEKPSRKFSRSATVPRDDARCVRCGALERQRFVWLYLGKMTNLFDGTPKRMLHVAPERCFQSRLRKRLGKDYITADLKNRRASIRMDITDIQYPDGYFDVILCSHVLEHVQDDKRAMRELRRVLKQSGWAILLVPITTDKTFEDPAVIDPSARLKLFGQEDHVRLFGRNIFDRFTAVGLVSRVRGHEEALAEFDPKEYGVNVAEPFFLFERNDDHVIDKSLSGIL